MFVARSMFAAPSPAAAEACASTRAGDSKTAQCSPWCGPAHCGSWCKCRACPICASPPPPPPPRALAPPPPPRACTSTVAGDANVEGCASWCREKESAATQRVRHWHSSWPALWRLRAEALAAWFRRRLFHTCRFTASVASASRAASARAKRPSRRRLCTRLASELTPRWLALTRAATRRRREQRPQASLCLPASRQCRSAARRLSARPFRLPIRRLARRSATATLRSGRARASASPRTAPPSVREAGLEL